MTDKNSYDVPTRTVLVGGRPGSIVFRKYRLVVYEDGKKQSEAFLADKRRVTIGSSADNDLILTDKAVSRNHAEITINEKGYQLTDRDSKNGTLLDGVRIISAYLNPNSAITIGGTRVEFRFEDEEAEVTLWPDDAYGRLLGSSLEMRALYSILDRVAAQDVTVLVEGESGTGKELIVQEIHNHSKRAENAFIVFDCSAVPENLIESELFGHVKGAFTGATSDREGAFRLAHGGTLFLDEIGELPQDLQPKLLRALESKEVRPVGGSKSFQCDVRLIAATNRDLSEEVKKGSFRQDLYFRLNVVRLEVPPLRRRREDIPGLVESFLSSDTSPLPPVNVSADVLSMLMNHSWPGNVRELKNFVERYRVFAPDDAAVAADLLDTGRKKPDRETTTGFFRFELPFKEAKGQLVSRFEVEYCTRLLARHNNNISASAREAGIHRKYLEELVRKHSLK